VLPIRPLAFSNLRSAPLPTPRQVHVSLALLQLHRIANDSAATAGGGPDANSAELDGQAPPHGDDDAAPLPPLPPPGPPAEPVAPPRAGPLPPAGADAGADACCAAAGQPLPAPAWKAHDVCPYDSAASLKAASEGAPVSRSSARAPPDAAAPLVRHHAAAAAGLLALRQDAQQAFWFGQPGLLVQVGLMPRALGVACSPVHRTAALGATAPDTPALPQLLHVTRALRPPTGPDS
jgi:hypothetical protein